MADKEYRLALPAEQVGPLVYTRMAVAFRKFVDAEFQSEEEAIYRGALEALVWLFSELHDLPAPTIVAQLEKDYLAVKRAGLN